MVNVFKLLMMAIVLALLFVWIGSMLVASNNLAGLICLGVFFVVVLMSYNKLLNQKENTNRHIESSNNTDIIEL